MNDSMPEQEIRRHFPGVKRLRYFNAAAQGLLPLPVIDAMQSIAVKQSECGITGWGDYLGCLAATRDRIARWIEADPQEVAFVPTTGEGISRIATSLDWSRGDEVVLCDLEYPANVYPWAAQQRHGVKLRWVPGEAGRVDPQRYLDALGPNTKVVAVSQVQFTTGYLIDLQDLGRECRARDVLLCVDGIQAVGATRVDVKELGIGALAVEGRKWLLGPAGCGFLYVSDEWADRLRPQTIGARSVRNGDDELQYRRMLDAHGALDLGPLLLPGAQRFEVGFPNLTGIAGLGAALELLESIGSAEVFARIAEHVRHVVARLTEAGYRIYGTHSAAERAGIVAFEDPGDPQRTFAALNADGFSISVRDGRLRISPHVYNTAGEIDALIDRIAELTPPR